MHKSQFKKNWPLWLVLCSRVILTIKKKKFPLVNLQVLLSLWEYWVLINTQGLIKLLLKSTNHALRSTVCPEIPPPSQTAPGLYELTCLEEKTRLLTGRSHRSDAPDRRIHTAHRLRPPEEAGITGGADIALGRIIQQLPPATHTTSGHTTSWAPRTHTPTEHTPAWAPHTHTTSGHTTSWAPHTHTLLHELRTHTQQQNTLLHELLTHTHSTSEHTPAWAPHTHTTSEHTPAWAPHTHTTSEHTPAWAPHTLNIRTHSCMSSSHTHNIRTHSCMSSTHTQHQNTLLHELLTRTHVWPALLMDVVTHTFDLRSCWL